MYKIIKIIHDSDSLVSENLKKRVIFDNFVIFLKIRMKTQSKNLFLGC